MGDRSGFAWQSPPANNIIDEFVAAKLERMKTLSSALCTDLEFIRRVYLDLTGLPPAPEQVRAFMADASDSRWKRDQLIDQLIASGDFTDHWTNKWCDLLQVNSKNLQFDLDETHALLSQKLGSKATVELAARLHDLTEGWPMGLQLAITAIGQATDP